MSHAACLYVKHLKVAPNGERVTVIEKSILWYLADSHREEDRAAWPAIPTIAEDNNLSERRVREILQSCIDKRIVWRDPRERPNGSATSNNWRFTAIDGVPPAESVEAEKQRRSAGQFAAAKANAVKKAKRESALSGEISQEAGAESRMVGCGLPQGDDAESRRGIVRHLAPPEPLPELAKEPSSSLQGANTDHAPKGKQHAYGAMLMDWLRLKEELRRELGPDQWELWIRPAYLLAVLSGNTLLVALPPAGRVLEAARINLPLLRDKAAKAGYGGLVLARYPDEHDRDRVRREYPEFYAQMYGNRGAA